MKIEEIRTLGDRALDCVLAQAFGFTDIRWSEEIKDWRGFLQQGSEALVIPDFASNLDMLQRTEALLTPEQWARYLYGLFAGRFYVPRAGEIDAALDKLLLDDPDPLRGKLFSLWGMYCGFVRTARERAEVMLYALTAEGVEA